MSHYLITGAAGFIGSHLADALIEQGHEVSVVDNLLLGKRENVNVNAHFHEVDIRDTKKLTELCAGVEAVFHLAADPRLPVSIEDPMGTHDINVTGTLSVLTAARDAGVRKVIFSSTCALYGDQPLPIVETAIPKPMSPYGLHKLMGEKYCELFSALFGLETVCLRYFNVFGPRKTADGGYPMVIPIFLKQKSEGKPLTIVGDGTKTRDYVFVSDVVEANLKALAGNVTDGTVINIGSGRQISVNEIAALIGGPTETLPPRIGEMQFIEADNKRAAELLGWKPTVTFEDGLQKAAEYFGVTLA